MESQKQRLNFSFTGDNKLQISLESEKILQFASKFQNEPRSAGLENRGHVKKVISNSGRISSPDFKYFPQDASRFAMMHRSQTLKEDAGEAVRKPSITGPQSTDILRYDRMQSARRAYAELMRNSLEEQIVIGCSLKGKKSMNIHDSRFIADNLKATGLLNDANGWKARCAGLSEDKLIKKAARHFKDALFFQAPRDDLDKPRYPGVVTIYNFQISVIWNVFLLLVCWLLLFITFLEPTYGSDTAYVHSDRGNLYEASKGIEIAVVIIIWIDALFELYHKIHDNSKPGCKRLMGDKKTTFKILFGACLLADLLAFHICYPRVIFRFSRVLRPVGIFLYSRETRRAAQALLHSIRGLIEILILLFVLSFGFALFGRKLFGKQSDESTFEKQFQYNSLYEFFNAAYMLLSAQSFPSIMYPSLQYTLYSLAYYLPYIAISTLLLYPAPIGIFMKEYNVHNYFPLLSLMQYFNQNHRRKTIIQDNLLQYEALISSFKCLTISLDTPTSLDSASFLKFMHHLYPDIPETTIRNEVLEKLDIHQEGYLTWSEFLAIPKLISQSETIPSLTWPRLKLWRRMRLAVAAKLHIGKIAESFYYKYALLLMILANIGLNLYILISHDDNTPNGVYQVQYAFLGVYVLDNVLNFMQKGLANHFASIANILDAVLYLVFIWTPFSLSFLRITSFCSHLLKEKFNTQKSFKSKLSKEEADRKTAIDSFSFLRKFLSIAKHLIIREFLLVQKLIQCASIVLKIAVILAMIIFFFSIIGIEIYNPNFQREGASLDPYINFQTFGFACLSLFQLITQQSWADNYYINIKNYTHSEVVNAIYFLSFYSIGNIVVISLIRGLICEVFLTTDIENDAFRTSETGNSKSFTASKAFSGSPTDLLFGRSTGNEIHVVDQKSPKLVTTELQEKLVQPNSPESFPILPTKRSKSKSKTFTPFNPNVMVFAPEPHGNKLTSEKSIKFTHYDESNRSQSQTQRVQKRQLSPEHSRSLNSSISKDDSMVRDLKASAIRFKNMSYDDQSSGTFISKFEEDDLMEARDAKVHYLSSLYKMFRMKNEVPPKFYRNYRPETHKTSEVTSDEFTFYADHLPPTTLSQQERKADSNLAQYLSPHQLPRQVVDNRVKDGSPNQHQMSKLSFPRSLGSSNQMKSSFLRESAGFPQSWKDSDLQKPSSSLRVFSVQKGSAESNYTKILTLDFEIMINERQFYLRCFKPITSHSKASIVYENADKIQSKLNELMNPSTAEMQMMMDRKPKNPRDYEESFIKEKTLEIKKKTRKSSEILLKKITGKNGETQDISNVESSYTKFQESFRGSNYYEREKLQEQKNSTLLEVSRVLRLKSTPPRIYSKLLATAEKVINSKILSKKSFIKIVFLAADDKYFVFDTNKIKDEDVYLKSIKKGPWFYADEILPVEAMLYKGKNLLSPREEKDQMAVDRFKEELESVLFRSQDKPMKLETWMRKDMYIIPFKNDDLFGVSRRLYEKFSHVKYVDKKRADSATIKDFFVSVFHQRNYGKSQNNFDDPLNRSNNMSNGTKKSGFEFEENNQSLEAEKIDEDREVMRKGELIEFLADLKSMFLPYKSLVFENLSHLYFEKKAKAAGIEIE